MKICFCGKELISAANYCNWECHVAEAKSNGAVEHLPNGLPIQCIHDGLLLEHECGDHKNYKFPVVIEYVGLYDLDEAQELKWFNMEVNEENYRKYKSECHALIYTDGNIALTMYECNYAMHSLRSGDSLGRYNQEGCYKLSEESRLKIIKYASEQEESFEKAWSRKEKVGYQYGEDALEQVRFGCGWEIAKGIK